MLDFGTMLDTNIEIFTKTKAPRWTAEEDQYLKDHLGYLSEEEMAAHLGRSVNAVHLRWERGLGLPAPSKTPGWLTGGGIAKKLGIDNHTVMKWTDRGLLPHRIIPGDRTIRLIRETTFMRWVVNPMNWPYFQPWNREIPDPHIAGLIAKQQARWDDEWLAPGQAAEMHGIDHTDVNRFIRLGRIKALKWNNWWVLRSEAAKPDWHAYKRGKGNAPRLVWSREADAFIFLAYAVGHSPTGIAGMMKRTGSALSGRVYSLTTDQPDYIQNLIDQFSLPIRYDADRRRLWADWREHEDRFPYLAGVMARFCQGQGCYSERFVVSNVLYRWAGWHGERPERFQSVGRKKISYLFEQAGSIPGIRERLVGGAL